MMQKMKESYAFFSASGNGTWEFADDKIKMVGWKNLTLNKSHVMGFAKLNDLSLSKVEVELKYFDMFGGNETIKFAMRDGDFKAMKQALGK
jgi:hypothetical protein